MIKGTTIVAAASVFPPKMLTDRSFFLVLRRLTDEEALELIQASPPQSGRGGGRRKASANVSGQGDW